MRLYSVLVSPHGEAGQYRRHTDFHRVVVAALRCVVMWVAKKLFWWAADWRLKLYSHASYRFIPSS